jgi:hypothetical protein
MKSFEITLKNDKLKQYDRIALYIIIINLALFIYLAISTEIKSVKISATIGSIFIIITLAIDYFLTSIKKNQDSPYKLAAEYAISFAWFQMGYWWIAILTFLLGTLYLIAKRPLLVSIIKENIIYPSFPKKKLSWPELNNIILKDGLLTIDLKNNKFIQQSVDESKTSVNEQEFNDFCREQLNK